ncbi:MAG: GTP cyclohydrolase II, partial [Sphingomonadales bacterium]
AKRAEVLNIATKGRQAVALLPDFGPERMSMRADDLRSLADPTLDMARPVKGPFPLDEEAETESQRAALQLCKIAGLLPAALVFEATAGNPADSAAASNPAASNVKASNVKAGGALPILEIPVDVISGQAGAGGAGDMSLTEVGRARLPLAGAEDTRIVVFRPKPGGAEHLALLIGEWSGRQPVLVRVHSACLTGDILGSLKCDCGQQLDGAVKAISQAGGGVLLYLAQEGRGIGLVAKIKAYSLQDQGFDTMEANRRLGFEDDERLFQPAAAILGQLGIKTIRLLTNNPAKVAALSSLGITVAEVVPHTFPANPHSENYLQTKKEKAGHRL